MMKTSESRWLQSDRTRPVFGGVLSDRTRPVATPDASGVKQKRQCSVERSIGRWQCPVRYDRTCPVVRGCLLDSTER